ncbi:MAG TPA: protein-disulfide reductase DsbD domain-containing protein [Verrucomicrobiae bacterium]|nr:protein-disulfide reductase DsbD domain-containing protein [Verrucomicrobiae bacterium]
MFCLAAFAARAAHTQAKLILSADTTKPGDTIWAGVDLKMEPDWHTYWKNPGDAGMATSIKWQLPPGISAGEIQWPLPEKLPPLEVTTYGYENETVLLVPLTISTNLSASELNLKANVSWLECKDVCIPAEQDVEAKLTIGSETKNSADAATIDSWKEKLPTNPTNFLLAAWWWQSISNSDTRAFILQAHLPKPNGADFFPDSNDNFEIQPETKFTFDEYSDSIILYKSIKKFSGDWPTQISGVLVVEKGNSRSGYQITTPIVTQVLANSTNVPSVSNSTNSVTSNLPAKSIWQYLLYAFIGGLILNIMPCVLPVIALKILGFVSEARSEPRRVRNLGFIYALGVLVSFLALAGIIIGVKAAGHHAGWGMQFGNPVFVVCLTTLVLLVALNLFGVFEITPGGKILNAAGQLASKHGAPGAFFNGVLATILATPCTAPFLSAALAFAFTQNTATIILIFLFVGIGLAAPYVLLSCNPALLKFLPKPGAWMEKFKIAMGFPMLATVVWLFNVAASDYGARVFWLGVFLVAVAFATWIFGEFVQRGRNGKTIAFAVILIFLAGGYIFALENKLHWREMNSETGATNSLANSSNGIQWQSWSPEAITQARAAGKIALVDFTATWCVTCNAIIKPALENDSVVAKLKEIGASTFLADYTRTPQNMTDEISKYGAGVPLVLVYPKNSSEPPIVLPQPSPLQLPSGYAKIILDALERAAD